jgi:hypothetical protein
MTPDTAPNYALPTFVPPATTQEARERMAELDVAIASINDQIQYRELADDLSPDWFKKAATSRRFKALERQRIESWLHEYNDAADHGIRLETFIVDLVRDEFEPDEWTAIMADAQAARAAAMRDRAD